MHSVSAIIVTYNPELSFFKNQIEAIAKQVDVVFIVDNASENKIELSLFSKTNAKVQYIQNEKNLGLAEAQNIAIKNAIDLDKTHVILFDQDSIIESDFVSKQLECERYLINNGCAVAAIGPSFYDNTSGYQYPATVYKGPFIKRVPIKTEPVKATFIIASGALIRTSVLKDIGYMSEGFFIDFIDIEWGLRASNLGYYSYINPNILMAHNIGDRRIKIFGRLISIHSNIRKYYILRNGWFLLRSDYVPLGYKVRLFFFNLIRIVLWLFVCDNKFKMLPFIYKGVMDGVRGVSGPLNADLNTERRN